MNEVEVARIKELKGELVTNQTELEACIANQRTVMTARNAMLKEIVDLEVIVYA